MIRRGERLRGVEYSRKYFAPVKETEQWAELEQILGLLAFSPDTPIPAYRHLFSETRWGDLIGLFREENYRLYQLAHQSVFSACLQTGISALKTPECGQESSRGTRPKSRGIRECPVCLPDVPGPRRPPPVRPLFPVPPRLLHQRGAAQREQPPSHAPQRDGLRGERSGSPGGERRRTRHVSTDGDDFRGPRSTASLRHVESFYYSLPVLVVVLKRMEARWVLLAVHVTLFCPRSPRGRRAPFHLSLARIHPK